MALVEKCDPTKRKWSGRGSRKRMAPSGVRCLPGDLDLSSSSDVRGVPGGFGCRVGSRGWMSWGDALLGAYLWV